MLHRRKDLEFIATALAYRRDPEVEAEYLVVCEQPNGGGRTIEVQRSLAEGADDARPDLGGHCLVIDGGPTSYRCVERWVVADTTIVIGLTAGGSDELGVTTIRIKVPNDAAAASASALQRLIDGGPEVDDFTVIGTP
jgi:Immunity protein 10